MHHLTAEYMERSAGNGPRPQFARTCEITVLDIADSIASAKVVSEPLVDYLHLDKLDGPMVDRQTFCTRTREFAIE